MVSEMVIVALCKWEGDKWTEETLSHHIFPLIHTSSHPYLKARLLLLSAHLVKNMEQKELVKVSPAARNVFKEVLQVLQKGEGEISVDLIQAVIALREWEDFARILSEWASQDSIQKEGKVFLTS
ncbi:unnamed protein product [Darwinula stevensoni]|uniref:Uncharacterized protein n=1 Tax=Darwinula stevensoni TaxID=69355 RepID=A0A7R9AA51_9CRUS|nr:unnamed protein product [Darwinula stevensoni]CAG0897870.1 unnamed protein product [Darwinula stevensoni]